MENTLFDKWREYRYKYIPFTLQEIVENLSSAEEDELFEPKLKDFNRLAADLYSDQNNQEIYDELILKSTEYFRHAQFVLTPLAARMARVLPPLEELDR